MAVGAGLAASGIYIASTALSLPDPVPIVVGPSAFALLFVVPRLRLAALGAIAGYLVYLSWLLVMWMT